MRRSHAVNKRRVKATRVPAGWAARPLRAHLEGDVMSDLPTNTLPRWPSSPAWSSTANECGH